MKVQSIFLAAIFTLTGCQSPIDDMLNNQFVSISPQATPKSLVGNWTGNMGPYLTTFSFENDGYGVFCYSYGTANVIQKIKYATNIIYIQDGTKLELKSMDVNSFIANSIYFGGNESTFYKDTALREASQFCASQLSI
ncbi:J517_1871 family lipoprotein [Aliagarivorans taiwanensis]|uniref:J517_1871 family lipoprotein n=1 Tax=Aliagarivorans taiwanensis TaxID=561966 RepID=UPI000683EDCD|nr:J517_1871 family lipoprotein [Aliagarivorans taiwanensis]